MSELMIGDRLIDKIHGIVILVDAYNEAQILFEVEKTGKTIYRTLTHVQSMKPAPPEGRLEAFCKSVVIGVCMVIICTLIVVISNKVVVCSQGEAQTIKEHLQCLTL